jgi:hypothetical protein
LLLSIDTSPDCSLMTKPRSSETLACMLLTTKEAAVAFVEDMAHMREMLARQDHPPGQIRLLSAVLRRLLVNNDLRSSAPPRIGSLSLSAPDNNPVYHAARKQPLSLFVSGGISVFNCEFRAITGGVGKDFIIEEPFDRATLISLPLDSFLTQRVIAFDNKWVSRQQIIKYVAHIASGVHSSQPESPEDTLLSRLKSYLKFSAHNGGARISVNYASYTSKTTVDFVWIPDSVDAVLIELLSAAHFLSISPCIIALEKHIKSEFGF